MNIRQRVNMWLHYLGKRRVTFETLASTHIDDEMEGEVDCDGCGKPTLKWDLFLLGTYALQVERNSPSYYCEECFTTRCKDWVEYKEGRK